MLKLTRTGIGLLTRQYRSVLHKCWMINVGLWTLTAVTTLSPSQVWANVADYIKPDDYIEVNERVGNLTGNITNTLYRNIKSSEELGSVIYNTTTSGYNITADFVNNDAAMPGSFHGGAIHNVGVINNIQGYFGGNTSACDGGGIYNSGTIRNITGTFENNHSSYGSAIYIDGGSTHVSDSAFYNNQSKAIRTVGTLYIQSIITNTIFSGNGIGLYLEGSYTYLDAAEDRKITFNDIISSGLSGRGNLVINANKEDIYGGVYEFNNGIKGVNVYLKNNARLKLGSVTINNATTYGYFGDSEYYVGNLTTDENGGYVDMRNSHIENNSAATLTLGSQLKIGLDIQHPTSGTTGTADNITFTTGSGSILIDAINEIGTRPTATGTYLYQVLNGSGVTLALTDAIKTEWNTDTTTSSPKVRDPIAATTAWTDKIYNRWTDTRVQGSLDVSGNNLVYSVINTQTAQSEVAGDTLALVTTATNNASRIFSTTDATAEYLLSTNLGAVNAVYKNLSINGTVSEDNRSTLNLGNYNGFVLDSSDDNLSLSSMKVSGGTDYSVNLADSGSKLDVANVIMDSTAAPITGAGNVEFTGDNEINAKVLNTGTTTVSSGTTDFNDKVAGFTVSAPATVSIAADDITAETTNNGTLELEGGTNIDTPKILSSRLLGAGKLRIMNSVMLGAGNSATTGSLSFGSSSDYADSILTSSSAASTSDHALVTAGYLDNNYYMNYGDSMAKSFIKAVNDNHKNVITRQTACCYAVDRVISANSNDSAEILW